MQLLNLRKNMPQIIRRQFDLINKVPDSLKFQEDGSEDYYSVPSIALGELQGSLKENEDNTVKAFVEDSLEVEKVYLYVGYHKEANRAFIMVCGKDVKLLGQEIE